MISVTQRCDDCGERSLVGRPCQTCQPTTPLPVRILARLATVGLAAVALAAAALNSVG